MFRNIEKIFIDKIKPRKKKSTILTVENFEYKYSKILEIDFQIILENHTTY